MRVRIRNFQSIADAEIEISGFTVITGTNNSGKTAVMRALRGVFTNAPAGSLLRWGAAYLSVTLSFDDGNTITWEKGWEKPDRKGKTVNRYIINGKELPNVGRGAPAEVLALGFEEVHAGSDRFWPQFAEQVTGSLFLVDRPGSVVAEALSDVERVGKLSAALRAAESDRRSTSDRLRVRRDDLRVARERATHFDGLDSVLPLAEDLRARNATIAALRTEIAEGSALLSRLVRARDRVRFFDGFDPSITPDSDGVRRTATTLAAHEGMLAALRTAREEATHLEIWTGVPELPETTPIGDVARTLTETRSLLERLSKARRRVADLPTVIPVLPDPATALRLRSAIGILTDFGDTLRKRADAVALLDVKGESLADDLARAEEKVRTLLGDRGECPTCGTVHGGTTHTVGGVP